MIIYEHVQIIFFEDLLTYRNIVRYDSQIKFTVVYFLYKKKNHPYKLCKTFRIFRKLF